MEGASEQASTSSVSTSQNSAIFSRTPSVISWSDRHTMKSGCTPKLRSSFTECWVGFVFTSWAAAMYGTSVTWTNSTLPGPISFLNWRAASMKGRPSMSPMVPPISEMTMSAPDCSAARRIRSLMASVTCGMTCTVPPRKSPRRSRAMSVW